MGVNKNTPVMNGEPARNSNDAAEIADGLRKG
jgi:hypothetical protein